MVQVAQKNLVTTQLERVCQVLELTEKQYSRAETEYGAVGELLAGSNDPFLRAAQIYPQGSISIGTSVKPILSNEYDVDLVCYVPSMSPDTPASYLKKIIGDRLRSDDRYKDILEQKSRCWRLNYRNEFHLDITPSIRNPRCREGGELVPDKNLDEWKATNPKGYKNLFEERAKLQPKMGVLKAENRIFASASIEPFPEQVKFKGLLRRIIQVLKRHRDEHFKEEHSEYAPISVILTTLASQSYEYSAVSPIFYESEFDVVIDVIRNMTSFVTKSQVNGGLRYSVINETTSGENFAEKWNSDLRLPEAFYGWHRKLLVDVESLPTLVGLDNLRKSMNKSFGESAVAKAFEIDLLEKGSARINGILGVAPALGLTTHHSRSSTVSIPHNTFFGSKH